MLEVGKFHFFQPTKKERMSMILKALSKYAVLGWLFFHSIPMMTLTSLLALYDYYMNIKSIDQIKHNRFKEQFMNGIYSLSSSLATGRSLEGAFYGSYQELKNDPVDNEMVLEVWLWITSQLQVNEPIDQILNQLSESVKDEDVSNFVTVMSVAHRQGGDLIRIIKDTLVIMKDKELLRRDWMAMTVEKRLEQQIMNMVIPGIMVFFLITSPTFIEPLYFDVRGKLVMILVLIGYLVSDYVGKRLIRIEV